MDEHFAANLRNWDNRAELHATDETGSYRIPRVLAGGSCLHELETRELGDIAGRDIVHLQCHIGTDTLSLTRLGAQMVGLDFSPASLAQARTITARAGADIDFVEGTVDDAVTVLGRGGFDLVYTGIGAIGWLPRIADWAQTVSDLLRPGGRLFIREGHPVLWSLADVEGMADPHLRIAYSYFEQAEPHVWEGEGTYVETDVQFTARPSYEWNHGLGEIFTALLTRGMEITGFVEHDSVPWEALPGLMERDNRGEYRLREGRERLPMSYTLQAVKRR